MRIYIKIFIMLVLTFMFTGLYSQSIDSLLTGSQYTIDYKMTNQPQSRLYNQGLSMGIIPFIPALYGMRTEFNKYDFGISLSIIYLPDANLFSGSSDNQPNRIKDNSFFCAINFLYYYFLSRNIYLFAGPYGMVQFRKTYEYTEENGKMLLKQNDYQGFSYGLMIGTKQFFFENLFVEEGVFAGYYPEYKPIEGKVTGKKLNTFPLVSIGWKF